MFLLTLGKLAHIVNGTLVRGKSSTRIHHVVYQNTKFMGPKKAFLLGTRFLNKWTMRDLIERKSAVIIAPVSWRNKIPHHHSLILVKDANQALWKISKWQRHQSSATFIGITGSQGKTTTKEMLSSILQLKYRTLKTNANNNLAATVPTHLFYLNAKHEAVVFEMGMASLGNIFKQCLYAQPSIGAITNVGEAHVGSLGSSLKNVVRAKQELINGLHPKGFLVLNADDLGSQHLRTDKFKGTIVYFGIKNQADIRAQQIRYTQDGMHFQVDNVPYTIPTWGKHNVYNALVAIAIARHMKVPTNFIQKGLSSYRHPSMRLQRLRGIHDHVLINDAYNANPTSMIEGLKVLKKVSTNRRAVAVLGDMSELGQYTQKGHKKVGKAVSMLKPDLVITIGPKAAGIATSAIAHGFPRSSVRSFSKQNVALAFIKKSLQKNSILYFKASRDVGLEWIIRRLRAK